MSKVQTVQPTTPLPPPTKHQLALMIWVAVFPTLTVLNLAFGDRGQPPWRPPPRDVSCAWDVAARWADANRPQLQR